MRERPVARRPEAAVPGAAAALALLAALLASGEDRKERRDQAVAFKVPQSLKLEHDELHAELVKATRAGGKTGEAARAVAGLLHPHFEKEEEYALPPLGLLGQLAEGKVAAEMEAAIALTDRLQADLPRMLEEHRSVVAALDRLTAAAKEERKEGQARFAEKLALHARTEEEVLYPAAILVGRYLKRELRK